MNTVVVFLLAIAYICIGIACTVVLVRHVGRGLDEMTGFVVLLWPPLVLVAIMGAFTMICERIVQRFTTPARPDSPSKDAAV